MKEAGDGAPGDQVDHPCSTVSLVRSFQFLLKLSEGVSERLEIQDRVLPSHFLDVGPKVKRIKLRARIWIFDRVPGSLEKSFDRCDQETSDAGQS